MMDESVIRTQQIPANKLKAAWELLKLTFAEWMNDDTFELSAALAFYTIFSIAPVLLIAVGVASFFLAPDTATDQIVSEMEKMIGVQGANAVRQVIESSRGFGKGIWAVSVGIVTLITGATAVFGELQSALNQIWDVKAKPNRGVIMSFVIDRLRSFSIAICVGFLLLVSLVISAVISGLQNYMNHWLPGVPWVWQAANTVSSFFVVAVLFAAIYKFLPDVVISWKDVWVGAAVTALLFSAGKYLIGIYLGRTATASAFGAAGSLVVLLFWVYYSALISFLGAEFTQVYARRYGPGIRPKEHAVRVGRKSDSI
ncbi:MAG TPA: YihY/virulence factor BrkB family protein [Candidatus Udaeobacter sp.]|nr:YihY/virulence factor BrkB family protein [Candidatus Udaeobacter sp.]